ncbi:hypothetical protein BA896_021845 [Janthinobacterium lividum]|uniref:Uncharacterized protein n=1 Tax=Janthinobacterium lividum TaxID=29581 RepID=A0A1E8PLA0_9BURK|nr:hypothetical protein BA896_021845 [Janthinobacterium lividum]
MAKSKKEAITRTYEVLSPLHVGTDEYEQGDSIDMDDAEADELVAAGVLVLAALNAARLDPPNL